jgi:uncharacterized membrane protein YraQ (UPF0718 family)
MQSIQQFLSDLVMTVAGSLVHNWIALSLAVVISAVMRVYVNGDKLRGLLLGRPHISILAAVALGALTPLCACGTTAVVIGMLTTTLPWGPIMAFLTSSPLMSPEGFVLDAGILGLPFAVALTVASILIGLGSGYTTSLVERSTSFLMNQTRFRGRARAVAGAATCECIVPVAEPVCACSAPVAAPVCACNAPMAVPACACSAPAPAARRPVVRWRELGEAALNVGLKQIVVLFSIFVAVGFVIDRFVPSSIIIALFSARTAFAVPLAALVGLPLYVTGEAAVPLIQTLLKAGAGGGAMLAFMITGPATSAWVIAGVSTFMKRRVVGLYVLFILIGGIACGYLFELFQALTR